MTTAPHLDSTKVCGPDFVPAGRRVHSARRPCCRQNDRLESRSHMSGEFFMSGEFLNRRLMHGGCRWGFVGIKRVYKELLKYIRRKVFAA